jgi:hypothetical protein
MVSIIFTVEGQKRKKVGGAIAVNNKKEMTLKSLLNANDMLIRVEKARRSCNRHSFTSYDLET